MTSVLDRPAPPPDLTVPYGPRPEQVIDLRLPPFTVKPPLIVLVASESSHDASPGPPDPSVQLNIVVTY